MGEILVRAPQGEMIFRIAGDTPTDEEKAEIESVFSQPEPQERRRIEIDLATATPDEIREYAKLKRSQGIDPVTGGVALTDEYREEGVDYTSGVDGVEGFSRMMFGSLEKDEEKKAYLNDALGQGNYRQDALGRFILTQEGRQKLGLGEGPEVAIDEEGMSMGDLKEFIGAAGIPIAAGVGTSLIASGVGFVPGVLLTGTAAALGKALDEGIEYARGYQRQSTEDIARDIALEGLFSGGGEFIGRGLSNVFGYFIKGPGGQQNEALRAQAQNLLSRDLRPTVPGATTEGFRPILTRLQAVYEGVFPNERAATENLKILLRELKESAGVMNISDDAIKNLGAAVEKDIKKRYASEGDLLAGLQQAVDKDIEEAIGKIIEPLAKGFDPTEDLLKQINLAKRNFDDKLDQLYTKVNQNLGGAQIVPVQGLYKALQEAVAADPLAGRALARSDIAKNIQQLAKRGYATPLEINNIRKALTRASYTPELIANADAVALQNLKLATNEAMTDAEGLLAKLAKADAEFGAEAGAMPYKRDMLLRMGIADETAAGQLAGLDKKMLANSIATLRRTNNLYRAGVKRFDNGIVRTIYREASRNNGVLNSRFIFNTLIKEDNPEAVNALLKAVRGAPTTTIRDVGESARVARRQMIEGKPYQQALEEVQLLDKSDPYRKFVQREAARIEKEATETATTVGRGAEIAESLRQKLVSHFIEDSVNRSKSINSLTGAELIDTKKLAGQLTSKGSAMDRLLGAQKQEFDEMVDVLSRSNAEVTPAVLEQVTKGDLLSQIRGVRELEKTRVAVSRDQIRRKLATGEINQITDTLLKNPEAAKMAKDILDPNTFEMAKDAAMARIIDQIGGTVNKEGQIELAGDFFKEFTSGRLGKKLNKVLRGYGKEHIDTLFGPSTYDSLITISDDMILASNAAIAGKGGLAAPGIAMGLGAMAYILNPMHAAATAIGYGAMSRLLRNPKVLKAMMASRRKNSVKELFTGKFKSGDALGQGLQASLTILGAGTVQGMRGTSSQAAEEMKPALELARQKAQQQTSQLPSPQQMLPAIQSGLQNLNPFGQAAQPQSNLATSPIVNPNPTTQALAQTLQQRSQ